jgi:hypothetical protein
MWILQSSVATLVMKCGFRCSVKRLFWKLTQITPKQLGRSAIGYAVALLPSDGAFGIEIKRLYVLHRFQQKGLGYLLLNEVLASARHDGVSEAFLKVQRINQTAVGFYSHNDFRVAGEESFRVGARDHRASVPSSPDLLNPSVWGLQAILRYPYGRLTLHRRGAVLCSVA